MRVLFQSVSALLFVVVFGLVVEASPPSGEAQLSSPSVSATAALRAVGHEHWDVYVQWKAGGPWAFWSEEGSQKHAETAVFNLKNGGMPGVGRANDATYYYYNN